MFPATAWLLNFSCAAHCNSLFAIEQSPACYFQCILYKYFFLPYDAIEHNVKPEQAAYGCHEKMLYKGASPTILLGHGATNVDHCSSVGSIILQ
jgi:hypothetical protein